MQFRKEKLLKFRFSLCLPAVGVGSVKKKKERCYEEEKTMVDIRR